MYYVIYCVEREVFCFEIKYLCARVCVYKFMVYGKCFNWLFRGLEGERLEGYSLEELGKR